MKSSRTKIMVAALALAILAAVAVSQTVTRTQWHGGGGMHGEHMLSFYTDYLDLTDAQQAQAKDIMDKNKTALQPFFEQMGQSRRDLSQLEQSATFDEAKVRALATQQAANMTEFIVQEARMKSQLFQILTPDQKAKMTKLMDRHGMKHGPSAPPPPDQDTNQ